MVSSNRKKTLGQAILAEGDHVLDFITEYGDLFDVVKRFGGITAFLAAYAPKPAGAGSEKTGQSFLGTRPSSDQVDRFEKFFKGYKSLSPKEKRGVNEIFKKKQRRARPSAETWT